jgi:hypothetical protein
MMFQKAKLRFLLFNLKLKYQPRGRKQTVGVTTAMINPARTKRDSEHRKHTS